MKCHQQHHLPLINLHFFPFLERMFPKFWLSTWCHGKHAAQFREGRFRPLGHAHRVNLDGESFTMVSTSGGALNGNDSSRLRQQLFIPRPTAKTLCLFFVGRHFRIFIYPFLLFSFSQIWSLRWLKESEIVLFVHRWNFSHSSECRILPSPYSRLSLPRKIMPL